MEHESLDFKIVMDDGPHAEVLGRLANLDIASAAYLQATLKYPLRNVQLRQGTHVIKRHDGEPKPEPPKDPNLRSWSAHLIGGKKMQLLGFVEAERTCGDRERCRIVQARRAEAQAPRCQSPTLAVPSRDQLHRDAGAVRACCRPAALTASRGRLWSRPRANRTASAVAGDMR